MVGKSDRIIQVQAQHTDNGATIEWISHAYEQLDSETDIEMVRKDAEVGQWL